MTNLFVGLTTTKTPVEGAELELRASVKNVFDTKYVISQFSRT